MVGHLGESEDHEWESPMADRQKSGCPCCSGYKIVNSNCLALVNPSLAAEFHISKNGGLTAKDIGVGTGKKVFWQCSKVTEHVWKASVTNRSKGRGCPYCAGKLVTDSNCLEKTHPEIARSWHERRN